MITSVSLNPSIDRTLRVARLVPGGLNRVQSQTDVAAGKGVNVALAASVLGAESECIGFMYPEGGRLFENRLAGGGVAGDFVWCEGAVRVNMKVLDCEKGEITELNQSGMPVTEKQLEEMTQMTLAHARRTGFLILAGSMPPCCPVDYYRTLAEAASKEGCRVIIDADGERLSQGIQAKPFLIKPNRYELELLCGRKLETRQELLEAARECIAAGVELVVISLGGEGALVTDGRKALYTPGVKLEVQSTVAAGDSMIAGLAVGFERGYDLEAAFRLGVAAASARCMTPPDEMISRELCEKLARELYVDKIELK